MGSVYCESEPSLIETAAIVPVFCDGSVVAVHNGLAHVTLFVEQPCIDAPGTFEKVVIQRIVMKAEAALAAASTTAAAILKSVSNVPLCTDLGALANH